MISITERSYSPCSPSIEYSPTITKRLRYRSPTEQERSIFLQESSTSINRLFYLAIVGSLLILSLFLQGIGHLISEQQRRYRRSTMVQAYKTIGKSKKGSTRREKYTRAHSELDRLKKKTLAETLVRLHTSAEGIFPREIWLTKSQKANGKSPVREPKIHE